MIYYNIRTESISFSEMNRLKTTITVGQKKLFELGFHILLDTEVKSFNYFFDLKPSFFLQNFQQIKIIAIFLLSGWHEYFFYLLEILY